MKLEKQNAPFVVVTKWEVNSSDFDEQINNWNNSSAKKLLSNSVLYKGIEKQELVLLYAVNSFEEVERFVTSNEFQDFVNQIEETTLSDLHQEIVALVKQIRPRDNLLPTTRYMQLRSIEVPLQGMEDYLEWREKTIFEFVRENKKLDSFVVFHSLFSSTPGVLFITEFSGDPIEYRNSFLTPEYQKIIKEAGHDHIKGGLNTFEYERVS